MKQQDFNKKADKLFGNIFYIFVFLLLIWVGYNVVTDIFGWIGNKMDRNDSKKQRCIEETYNIKNEFTAKKMYKACMKR
jgi:hypothetical protein